jgi:hypothetical protein
VKVTSVVSMVCVFKGVANKGTLKQKTEHLIYIIITSKSFRNLFYLIFSFALEFDSYVTNGYSAIYKSKE